MSVKVPIDLSWSSLDITCVMKYGGKVSVIDCRPHGHENLKATFFFPVLVVNASIKKGKKKDQK